MRYPLMLQAFIVVAHIVPEARLHRPNVRGIYTLEEHVHDHEIVIPRKVTHRGELISHNVTHHHDDGSEVHYQLSVAGNEYHVELTAMDNFIGPGMVVERRKRNVHVRGPPKDRSSKCHYRGFIHGHPNSQVALSACDGLCILATAQTMRTTQYYQRGQDILVLTKDCSESAGSSRSIDHEAGAELAVKGEIELPRGRVREGAENKPMADGNAMATDTANQLFTG